MSTQAPQTTSPPNAPRQELNLLPSPVHRLMEAIALKNYAISKGNTVSDSILTVLNEAERTYQNNKDLSEYGISIDKAISELTTATYPTTGESLLLNQNPPTSVRYFRYVLPILLVIALGAAIWGYAGGAQAMPLSVLAM